MNRLEPSGPAMGERSQSVQGNKAKATDISGTNAH